MASSLKFLRKTEWAREKLERFYLYSYKSLPEPGEDEFEIPPRQRIIPLHIKAKEPKVLVKGEAIVPLSKESFKETHRAKPEYKKQPKRDNKMPKVRSSNNGNDSKQSNKSVDPYADAPR